jgi:hypothetical protein
LQRGDLSKAQSLPHEAMSQYEKALGFCANHPDGIVGISELLLDVYDEKMAPEADEPMPDYLSMSNWVEGSVIADGTSSVADTNTIRGSIHTGTTSASVRPFDISRSASTSAMAVTRARETFSAPISRTQTSASVALSSAVSPAGTPGPGNAGAGSPQSMPTAMTATSPLPASARTSRRPSTVQLLSSSSMAVSQNSIQAATSTATPNNGDATPASGSAADAQATETSPEFLARLAARDRAYLLLSMLTKLGSGWDCSEAWFGLARAYEASGQVDKAKEVLWWCVELEDSKPLREWKCVGVL